MAVQVVAYELWLASRKPRGGEGTVAVAPHASAQEMERFYEQLSEVLDEIDFRDRTGSGNLMARLRRFFNRAAPDENEIHILRGILTAVQGRRRRAGEPHRARAAPGT
jgi:tRNA C32,U32 (ribose-2'-O)-methylase TrmJ